MNRRMPWVAGLAACVLLATLGVACGEDDDEEQGRVASATAVAGGSPVTDGNVVEVLLVEFSVVLDRGAVSAGEVTFRATNKGPNDPHEMVIIRTDLAPNALPMATDGSVLEDDIDLVNEIEELAVGDSAELTVELAAGTYVLICNIVQEEADGTIESHYQKGMRSALTVE